MGHRTLIAAVGMVALTCGSVAAEDNALGFYFSDTEFTEETATADITPGYGLMAYVVLTNATGSVVAGYEVSISSTAADFDILISSLDFLDENSGTHENQIVHFLVPKPVAAEGTVLSWLIFGTNSTEYEEINFGPADPPSLPLGVPVVDFGEGDLQPCSYPFGSPLVACLNCSSVAAEARSWSDVKALFE